MIEHPLLGSFVYFGGMLVCGILGYVQGFKDGKYYLLKALGSQFVKGFQEGLERPRRGGFKL